MRLANALALALVTLGVAAGQPAKAETVTPIETEGAVRAIVQTPRGTFVETERGTFRAEPGDCDDRLCLTPDVIRGLPERAPDGALPDGFVAATEDSDIRRAWYGRPTDRYAHAVLGDAIEGGSLVVETAEGTQLELVLPDDQVFEDITPRLHDFFRDGTIEIITIRASRSGGASVVVYGLRYGALVKIAASSENGRPNRWLSIVGVFPRDFLTPKLRAEPPYNEDQILFIRTPHIGGRLSSLSFTAEGIKERNRIMRDVSNHVIGSRLISMGSFLSNKDGGDFYVPSQDRRTLRSLRGAYGDVPLPGPIDKAIVDIDGALLTATEDGRLLVIAP